MRRLLLTLFLSVLLTSTCYATMDTPYPSGTRDDFNNTNTEYFAFSGKTNPSTTEADHQVPVAIAATASNLYVELTADPAAGNTVKITLRVNGADSDMTCTASDAETSCNDTVNTVSLSPGDLIDWEVTPGSTPDVGMIKLGCTLTTADNTTNLFGHMNTFSASSDRFASPQGTNQVNSNRYKAGMFFQVAGNITSIYAVSAGDIGDAGDALLFRIVEDYTSSDVSCTITDPATSCNDTGSRAMSVGDHASVELDPTNSPTAQVVAVGVGFEPTTNGESPLSYSAGDSPHATNTEYYAVHGGYPVSYTTWEASVQYLAPADFTLSDMTVYMDVVAGDGKSRTITFRNDGDSALSCAISGAADKTCTDAGSESILIGERLSYKWVPSGTPTATYTTRVYAKIFIEPSAEPSARRIFMTRIQ